MNKGQIKGHTLTKLLCQFLSSDLQPSGTLRHNALKQGISVPTADVYFSFSLRVQLPLC